MIILWQIYRLSLPEKEFENPLKF